MTGRRELIDQLSREGLDDRAIADRMGILPDSVKRTRSMFSEGGGDAFAKMIRNGSIALGKRIVELQSRRAT